MNVSFFNTHLNGGAANAAIRLFNTMNRFEELDLTFIYRFGDVKKSSLMGNTSQYEPILNSANILKRGMNSLKGRLYYNALKQHLRNPPKEFELFSFPNMYYRTQPPQPTVQSTTNIFHLHWIEEWLDYSSFFKGINNSTPIVWTLHDMNPITGGCHFSYNCNKFKTDCSNCPQLTNGHKHYASKNLKTKQKIFQHKNIHIVAPSNWMATCAKASQVFKGKPIYTIPNGIDIHKFSIKNKEEARRRLNIPKNEFLVLFVAGNIENPRKGFDLLLKALNNIDNKYKLTLLTLGPFCREQLGNNFKHKQKNIGYTNDLKEIINVYNAADLFVIPSIEDNLPNTLLEAMACGLPAVAFDIGGNRDVIINGFNGYLCQPFKTDQLTTSITKLIEHPERLSKLAYNARDTIEREFSNVLVANRHLDLYKEITNKKL